MSELRRPEDCPACASTRVVRIFYGSPTPETMEIVKRHEAVLGGCIVFAGQPDWECTRCRHRWYDPQDPEHQRRDALLEEIAARPPRPLPVPELTQRADGLRERVWRVKLAGRATRPGHELAPELRDRALREYQRCLADQGVDGAETILDVRVTTAAPRSYFVAIARGGSAPNWDMAADTWVMHALEALAGPIVDWQGAPRVLWEVWPLPPPERRQGERRRAAGKG
jgi:hypothetical protein